MDKRRKRRGNPIVLPELSAYASFLLLVYKRHTKRQNQAGC